MCGFVAHIKMRTPPGFSDRFIFSAILSWGIIPKFTDRRLRDCWFYFFLAVKECVAQIRDPLLERGLRVLRVLG